MPGQAPRDATATILLATSTGLASVDAAGVAGERVLDGHDVRAIAPAGGRRLWAIVDGRQIWRTAEDGGWRPVVSLDDVPGGDRLEALCLADTRANSVGGILVGTSGARLLRVSDDERIEVVGGFDATPGREEWYTPWGAPPDTRTISGDGDTVYVNVHVGGVLRSRDQGASWQPTIDFHADIHRVATHAGRVYAAGASGLSVSDDGGDSWRLSVTGLHATYCRSVVACGSALLLSASRGPRGGHAALYRAGLDATSWERCRDGLPEWFDGNLDSMCVDALPDGRLAAFATGSGDVYASTDQGASWRLVAGRTGSVRCVLTRT